MGGPESFKGIRFFAFVGGLIAAIGLAAYPTIIHPMMNIEAYKQVNKSVRESAGITTDKTQPHLKGWTDPFDRPGKPGNR